MTSTRLTYCQVAKCTRFWGPLFGPAEDAVMCCEAFPKGIPEDIMAGDNKHLEPVEGDSGLTFQARPTTIWVSISDQPWVGVDGYAVRVKGGPGSGNWGHAGRPGMVGGSAGRAGPMAAKIGEEGTERPTTAGDAEREQRKQMAVEWLSTKSKWSDATNFQVCDEDGEWRNADRGEVDIMADALSVHPTLEKLIAARDLRSVVVVENDKKFASEFGGKGASRVLAFFHRDYDAAYLRGMRKIDLDALHHELGHAVWNNTGTKGHRDWLVQWRNNPKFDRHTNYARTNAEEGFAEAYMAYVKSGGTSTFPRHQAIFDQVAAVLENMQS